MQLLLINLSTVLEEETKIYERLLSLSQGEQESIISGKMDRLNETVKKTEELILKIKGLEKRRQTVMGSLGNYFHLPPEELNISRLLELIDEPFVSQYAEHRKRLLTVIGELDEVNKSNANLVKHALNLTNDSLKIFFGGEEDAPLYNREAGKVEDQYQQTKILDRKA